MENIRKSLALLFAGAIASVIGGLLFSPPPIHKCLYILVLSVIVVLLVLYGSGAISKMWYAFNLWRRKGNKLFSPKVGILNDMDWEPQNDQISSWTDISPVEWKNEIEKCAKENKVKIKLKFIKTKNSFDSYSVVLNPYGGVYPERDFKNFETLNKIFDYVKKGGLFVNVADIPGYWAYNPLLKRRLDATPPIYNTVITDKGPLTIAFRDFRLTPFMVNLGLWVIDTKGKEIDKWNIEFEYEFNALHKKIDMITVYRVIVVEKNVKAIIKPKEYNLFGETHKVTPFFLVYYGNGKFLILLTFFGRENPKHVEIKGILTKIIIDLIRKKL